jgi:hypothetical protein
MLAALAAALGACSGMNGGGDALTPADSTPQVTGLPNQQSMQLTADDIVRVMSRAGFTDAQILDMGTILRNHLAGSGAAQIRVGRKVEALFAVDSSCLYVSSRLRGSFIYDVKAHTFR